MPTNPFEPPKEVETATRWRLDKWFWGWAFVSVGAFAVSGALIGLALFLFIVIVLQLRLDWTVGTLLSSLVGAIVGTMPAAHSVGSRAIRINKVSRLRNRES